MRLLSLQNVSWQDRGHFFAVLANMMRRILVDQARAKGVARRGDGALRLNLDDVPEVRSGWRDREIVAIHEALYVLAISEQSVMRD